MANLFAIRFTGLDTLAGWIGLICLLGMMAALGLFTIGFVLRSVRREDDEANNWLRYGALLSLVSMGLAAVCYVTLVPGVDVRASYLIWILVIVVFTTVCSRWWRARQSAGRQGVDDFGDR